jgi:predicted acylesterase/phospholipase RssA
MRTDYFYPNADKYGKDKKLSEIPISVAVRISTSIPYVFKPYLYQGDLYVDGCILDNFPIHVFDGEYPGCKLSRLNLSKPNPYVLGLNLLTAEFIDQNCSRHGSQYKRKEIKNIVSFSTTLLNTMMADSIRRIKTPSYWIRSIDIIVPSYEITKFKLSDKEKALLKEVGEKYVDKFFSKIE